MPVHQQDDATRDSAEELAHTLLVELLAYQFAFPVRWIETQETIMKAAKTSQRFVEIGPSQVLAPMAKKTAQQFLLHDQAHAITRDILSHSNHVDKVFYNYSQHTPSDLAPDATSKSTTSLSAEATPLAVSSPIQQDRTSLPVTAQIDDEPLAATDIVLALAAQKLKKAFDELPRARSVRELSGGRSTLQNELIGDLTAEFGAVPDGAEDLPLDALGAALAGKFSGSPGKQVSGVISKMIASKMPGGFNANAMKAYLESAWGIPNQRQRTILCVAITLEPASRLTDEKAAKDWLDSVIKRYARFIGIELSADGSSGAVATSAPVTIDAKSLEMAKEEQRKILKKQFDVLAKHLQEDTHLGSKQAAELLSTLRDAEDKLGRWAMEYDEEFFNGIKPMFDADKARSYDSWWNWARQDIMTLLNGISTGKFSKSSSDVLPLLSAIRNRLDKSCEDMIRHGASVLSNSGLDALLRRESLPNSLLRPRFSHHIPSYKPQTDVRETGEIQYFEVLRDLKSYSQLVRKGTQNTPHVHLRSRTEGVWTLNQEFTDTYLNVLDRGMQEGLSFGGKTALVTGAGPGSIGADIVRGLLQGGASVIVTTSREPSTSANFYQAMYQEFGSKGSSLKVIPFNAASRKDTDDLVDFVYSTASSVPDLDFIVPFAAISQTGQVDGLLSKSELAHRAMLVNLLRLLGAVKKHKESKRLLSRPTNVLLPLSPNHGTFGGDGLYGESKLGLETLFNRGQSESWTSLLTITGVVIGWTRGTGLMNSNNIVAPAIEERGVMTFSQSEMAFNVLSLMTTDISCLAEDEPIYADLTGGLHSVHDLKQIISAARSEILSRSRLQKALVSERDREKEVMEGKDAPAPTTHRPRARLALDFPTLHPYETMTKGLEDLQGMPDLERTIVVVGYSELGPWGNARTRWDIERTAQFTPAALVEMAWMMGLVKHQDNDSYSGWIDAETSKPVHEADFRTQYEQKIQKHTGLRFIEPEGLCGYNPSTKELMQEVVLEEDLPPFEASKATAEAFARRHGDKVALEPVLDSEDFKVHVKAGAQFFVPKAIEADRFVAGQLPNGWDPSKYGIPAEVIAQVDPIVVYALCCLSEAILTAGMQDPLELYKHIHVSELANCLGTGTGALLAMRSIYRDRFLDRPVQSDILQESYLNTIGAWSNMLLLASSGPIRSPTGTCATAVESLDAGCEVIKSGKAKVAITGGSEDFQEEMSFEFGNMKATCNTRDELRKGRKPSEMSRPTASSRAGFVESAGCGVQIIMSADLALRMGLPIYGIIGHTHMAGDKVGRSVPAPGQGVLTAAKESPSASSSPLLDLQYRKKMLSSQLQMIEASSKMQLRMLQDLGSTEDQISSVYNAVATACKDARYQWSNDIRKQDPNISPIRASLAAWGLTVDDIAVASFHGTSTTANDKNEANVINTQMMHLGRSIGSPLLVICQKYLTGHAKGAGGAFMLNGGIQVMQSGMVPGNRNADNVDQYLRQYEHLVFPSKTIETAGVKAFMLTSFGFGQKGGLIIMIHPQYLFSAIDSTTYDHYKERVETRQMRSNARFVQAIKTNSLFRAKDQSPWEAAGESIVFLDPNARVLGSDPFKLRFNPKNLHPSQSQEIRLPNLPVILPSSANANLQTDIAAWLKQAGRGTAIVTGVGVDVEDVTAIPSSNLNFVRRNYTPPEQEYCSNAMDATASYAGRWVAKEAVFKSLQTKSQGGGASMADIEVLPDDNNVPRVKLHGKAQEIAAAKTIERIEVSISHAEGTVVAVAAAIRGL